MAHASYVSSWRKGLAAALAFALWLAALPDVQAQPEGDPLSKGLEGKGVEAARSDLPVSFSDLIRRCWDLTRLPGPEDRVTCRQFSSYDRSGWKANRDFGNFLRTTEEEGHVCAEMEGPGCVFRVWSANPTGRVRFFLDGAETPALDCPLVDLFKGDRYPFLDPLAYRVSGANAYVPIPYQASCKIVLVDCNPLYYHFGYQSFPEGTRIETYSAEVAEAARSHLEEALGRLRRPGPGLAEVLYGESIESVPLQAAVPPEEAVDLFQRKGAGRIVLLQLKGVSAERHFLRKTMLNIYWDRDSAPAVHCPLGDFFGTSFGENPYRALPMGVTDEGGYCLFPMPFEEGTRIEIVNEGRFPVEVTGRLVVTALPGEGAHLRFRAGWRRENPCRTFDYPVLECTGKGKFVGCALYIDNPDTRWWGEGDEKILVDGEDFPSIFGTGTEDYFGDAWGHRPHIRPYQGCTLRQGPGHGNKTCVYRFHVTDAVPFAWSYKMTLENYAENVDYTSVAWWYQAPGGKSFFKSYPVEDRIPESPKAFRVLEGEDLRVTAAAGDTLVIGDESLPDELSRGKGLLLKGEGPFTVELPDGPEGNQRIFLGLASGLSHGALRITAPEGAPFRALPFPGGVPGFLERREAAHLFFASGGNRILIAFAEPAAEGAEHRAVLDFIAVEPMPVRPGALEAEELEVLALRSGRASLEHFTLPWSGGTQRRFEASGEYGILELKLPIPVEGEYAITAVCSDGPEYGPFIVTLDGEMQGEVVPAELTGAPLGAFTLQPKYLEAGDHTLTVLAKSTVGLDCFTFSWRLGSTHAVEGEDLKVVGQAGGEHRIQDLDPVRFSGGKQLWFRAGEEGAFVEAELPVKRTGFYRMKIFYCRSWDYGIVEVLLDGGVIGDPFDGYSPVIAPSGAVDYTILLLEEGVHRLRFRLAGRNERSGGYFMGVDGIVLKPERR